MARWYHAAHDRPGTAHARNARFYRAFETLDIHEMDRVLGHAVP
jgi:hypothetical protein